MKKLRQRFYQQGFRKARRAGYQAMPAGKYCDKKMVYHILLTDDNLRKLGSDALPGTADLLDCQPFELVFFSSQYSFSLSL
jgi:hypothetical protein